MNSIFTLIACSLLGVQSKVILFATCPTAFNTNTLDSSVWAQSWYPQWADLANWNKACPKLIVTNADGDAFGASFSSLFLGIS